MIHLDEIRSQQALSAWFHAASIPDGQHSPIQAQSQGNDEEEDENEFDMSTYAETESLGLRSKFGSSSNQSYTGAEAGSKTKDRLLEQLLGRKGAQAKRIQSRAEKHKAPINGPPSTKPKARARSLEEDSEDGSGRASAFVTKRQRQGPTRNADMNILEVAGADELASCEASDDKACPSKSVKSPSALNEHGHGSTTRGETSSSYLDQLLAKKKRKKGRRVNREQKKP